MSHRNLQVGVAPLAYYSGFSPVLNWWKTAQSPTITRTVGGNLSGAEIWSAGGYLDTTTGEIVSPAPSDLISIFRVFMSPVGSQQVAAGANFAGETFTYEFDGAATPSISGAVTITPITSNKGTLTIGATPTNSTLILTLTNSADPPRNIRIYQSRYATNVANGETFNPHWIAELRKFSTIRLMDWIYANNNSMTDFSQLATESYLMWGAPTNSAADCGPKSGIHPSLICSLVTATGCKVHVNLPIGCTDDFVTQYATYLKNNCSTEVTYELSNETWHFAFTQATYCLTQGNAIWPGDGARHHKWYGYRSAQCMKIIKDIYNDSSRWRGAINTSLVNTNVITEQLVGFAYWKSSTPSSLNFSDLFKGIYIGNYFLGTFVVSKPLTGISKTNPARIKSASHGYSDGQRIKVFFSTGPTSINSTFATVANKTTDYYDLSGVDLSAASGYTADTTLSAGAATSATSVSITSATGMAIGQVFGVLLDSGEYHWTTISNLVSATVTLAAAMPSAAASGKRVLCYSSTNLNNYTVKAALWDLMDISNTNFLADPTTYPTKYTYFNQQISKVAITGVCDEEYTDPINIAIMKNTWWPAIKTTAVSNGVELCSYEAGNGFSGDTALVGYGGEPQLNEYVIASGHSAEMALVYEELYRNSIAIGIREPSKFLIDGATSRFGTWAGVRYWPLVANGNTDDTGNPVWTVISAFRDSAVADSYTVSW